MRTSVSIAVVLLAGTMASVAAAAPLTNGNLLVVEAGPGFGTNGALNNRATAVAWRELTTGGAAVQSFNLNTGIAGARLTLGGSSTSEGYTASNGAFFSLAGYDTDASAATTATSVTARTVAHLDASGNITWNSVTGSSGASIRSAVTVDASGANTWTGSSNGIGNNGTAINSSNIRNVNIFNGQLMYSTQSLAAGPRGIYAFSGLPNAAATATAIINMDATVPSGTTGPAATPLPVDFHIAGTVAYVADERSAANGGGLFRFDLNTSTGQWQYSYTLNAGLTAGLRSIAIGTDGFIYATDALASSNNIVRVADTGAGSAFSIISTAGTNRVFRGIEVIPTPGAAAMLGLGGLLAARRRRA